MSLLACLASASALPVKVDPLSQYGPGPSAVPYGPRPYGPLPPQDSYQAKPLYVEEEEEKFEPQPYKYEYGVQDDYSKAAFAKSESQNEVGAVTGSYKVGGRNHGDHFQGWHHKNWINSNTIENSGKIWRKLDRMQRKLDRIQRKINQFLVLLINGPDSS